MFDDERPVFLGSPSIAALYDRSAPARIAALACWVLVVVSLRVSGAAQTVTATTGAVNGTVTDSSQAQVPGVTVSLSGPSLMNTRTVVTDAGGAYRFAAV